jgi:hypothetical protein
MLHKSALPWRGRALSLFVRPVSAVEVHGFHDLHSGGALCGGKVGKGLRGDWLWGTANLLAQQCGAGITPKNAAIVMRVDGY